ncbi:MAG: hypothetical protein R3253_13275, partial [Longimicrobiales bacterium]|nr:hypothetical protein [Longimicrobiales bacterium]
MSRRPAEPTTPAWSDLGSPAANDLLKARFRSWLWSSMIAATVVHFATFALWPTLTAADVAVDSDIFEVIEIPDEIDIPPPPP